MSDALNKYIEAATGITKVTKDTAEKIVKNLVEQGQAATRNPQEAVETLMERSQENRQAMVALVRGETKRVIQRMGLATQDEVERLQRQVADLRKRLREAEQDASTAREEAASATAPSKTKAAKKATKKKATKKKAAAKKAKKSVKKSAKKSGGSS